MKDDIASLFAYDRWANNRLFEVCRQLTPEQYTAEPLTGWSSIRSTVVHIAVVTEGWLRGLAGNRDESVPTEADLPALADAERLLNRGYQHLEQRLPILTPEYLATPLTLRRGTRTTTLPPWGLLRHLVNHATYHRGQIASKLKRFGVEPPITDLGIWLFEQVPQPS